MITGESGGVGNGSNVGGAGGCAERKSPGSGKLALAGVLARASSRFVSDRSESRASVQVLAYLHPVQLADCTGSVEASQEWMAVGRIRCQGRYGVVDAVGPGRRPAVAGRCTTGTRTRFGTTCQGYVMEHLGDPGGVLVVDETGVSQARPKVGGGKATVQRHGGEGGELSDRGIPGLWQPSRRGLSGPGALQYRQEWAADWVRRQEAGLCRKGWPSAPKHNWPKR